MRVYAWPPVGVVGSEWGLSAPVSQSLERFTGAVLESAAERRRRLATVVVEGAQGDSGGLMRVLERLLDGGLHAVRLHSPPANHLEDVGAIVPVAREIDWRTAVGGPLVTWRQDLGATDEVRWYAGAYAIPPGGPLFTPGAEWNGLGRGVATRLAPGRTAARAGQFVTVYGLGGITSETRMLVRPLVANSVGVAEVWVTEPFTLSVPAGEDGLALQVGTRETGIFKLDGAPPRWSRGLEDGFQVTWSFREAFADEHGEVVEVDPWAAAEWA